MLRVFRGPVHIFSGSFSPAWLHSSCSMAHQPIELSRKLMTKPCDRPSAALCTLEIQAAFYSEFCSAEYMGI